MIKFSYYLHSRRPFPTPHHFGKKVNVIFTVYEPHTAWYFANIAHTPCFIYTLIHNLEYTFLYAMALNTLKLSHSKTSKWFKVEC